MAQEKEDYSPSSSPSASPATHEDEEETTALTNGTNAVRPDLGFENVHYSGNSSEQDGSRCEKKNSNLNKKEESSLSFKHFLKRDLSLPSTNINNYEGTGAKPKIYSNSVHPSLGKLNLQPEAGSSASGSGICRKDNVNSSGKNRDVRSGNASSDSSIELNTNNDQNTFPRRVHTSNDALGMPSLPDFVQDHLLLEQAYLGTDANLSVDLDNLPDFTFNSNSSYNCTNSPDWSGNPKLYETCDVNAGGGPSLRLALDLTDSVERHHQQPGANNLSFPLDLPQHPATQSAGENLQLPDFLPANAGEGQSEDVENRERNRERIELDAERRLRQAAQRDLRASQQEVTNLRREIAAARAAEMRAWTSRESTARSSNTSPEEGAVGRDPEEDSLIASLKSQIEQLKLELRSCRQEIDDLRNARRTVARSLVHATNTAEMSLRDLLSGLEQVRGLANSMDPP